MPASGRYCYFSGGETKRFHRETSTLYQYLCYELTSYPSTSLGNCLSYASLFISRIDVPLSLSIHQGVIIKEYIIFIFKPRSTDRFTSYKTKSHNFSSCYNLHRVFNSWWLNPRMHRNLIAAQIYMTLMHLLAITTALHRNIVTITFHILFNQSLTLQRWYQ